MRPWHFAPPAGTHTGVADYAETLDRALAPFGIPEVNLYHIGNNSLHAKIYQQALREPGIVVLHDAVLHHFLLGHLTRDEYVGEFVYNYGEWRRPLGVALWNERGSSGVDARYFEHPMLKRIVAGARAVIVHNPGAAAMVRAHAPPALAIHVIPHFVQPGSVPDAAATELFRQRIGVKPGSFLFGIFGYLRETKRILPCVRAFRRLHAVHPDTALLLAGEATSPDLHRLLESEASHPAIFRLSHLSERDLTIAAAAVDCCLNLRYPAAGETSGIAIRLMSFGKPVIMTRSLETEPYPSGACLLIGSGAGEAAELWDYMALVARFPQTAREIGLQARRYLSEAHSLAVVAQRYWQVLAANQNRVRGASN